MKTRHVIVGLALVTTASIGSASAQQDKAALYAFHSSAVGGCPGLDWHVVIAPGGAISGLVAWDEMKHTARLSGVIGNDRTFKVDAQEVGGAKRNAVVTGRAGGDYIIASIDGSGTSCDKQPLDIPRAAGGMQGGGG